jgi:hypothetical protein
MPNKAQALFNCFKVTSGGVTVTQNFHVVSMETKLDTLNHNPSPTAAMGKQRSLARLIHSLLTHFTRTLSLKRVVYNAEYIF